MSGAGHGHGADHSAPGSKRIALLISVLALVLAFAETLGMAAQTTAIDKNIEASNLWSFFQAKTIRMTVVRTAAEAAEALDIEVGQIASSLIFKLPSGNPLLIITSGRHRVDTELVAKNLGITELGRADANYVKDVSGYSVGGVSPLGWISKPEMTLIDQALNDYEIVWAASGQRSRCRCRHRS